VYQRTCFESMGRDVGGTYRQQHKKAIAACQFAPYGSLRIGCLVGAVQDAFWDPSGQDEALAFCQALSVQEEKDACYATIFARAPDVLITVQEQEAFCRKAETEQQEMCQRFIQAR